MRVCWEEILNGVQSGDRSAGDRLYLAFCAIVRPLLVNRLGIDLAEDAMHEAFIRVLEVARRGSIRRPEAMQGYCLRAAGRAIVDVFRGCQRRPERAEVPSRRYEPRELRDPERQAIARELIYLALGSMSERERVACCREQSDSDLAEELQVEKIGVRVLRSRGRAKAAKAIGRMAA